MNRDVTQLELTAELAGRVATICGLLMTTRGDTVATVFGCVWAVGVGGRIFTNCIELLFRIGLPTIF